MKEEYDALVASQVYKDFSEAQPDDYLTNAFILYSSQYQAHWQFGFYNKITDKISAFTVKKEDDVYVIDQQVTDEVMKEPTETLLELSLDEITLSDEDALSNAITFVEKEYKSDAAQSRILLLQNTKEHGLIWNVTVISKAFDVVNVKLDAKSKEVLAHNKHSLLDMQANQG